MCFVFSGKPSIQVVQAVSNRCNLTTTTKDSTIINTWQRQRVTRSNPNSSLYSRRMVCSGRAISMFWSPIFKLFPYEFPQNYDQLVLIIGCLLLREQLCWDHKYTRPPERYNVMWVLATTCRTSSIGVVTDSGHIGTLSMVIATSLWYL